MTGTEAADDDAPPGGLSTQAAARVSAVLFIACGGVTALLVPLLGRDPTNVAGTVAVAMAAVLIGLTVWVVPWCRWPHRRTQVLMPTAVVVIAAFNALAAEPYLYDVFFIVAMVWLGVAHPPGSSVRWSPVVLAGYLAPALVLPDPLPVLTSAAYVVPVCVVVGEAVAWVAARLVRAEDGRRRSDARFEAVVRKSGELVLITDAEGCITYATPTTQAAMGLSVFEVVGRPIDELIHEDDRPILRSAIMRAVPDANRPPPVIEFRAQSHHGSWVWLEGVVSNLLDDADVAGVVINARDITTRRAADELLEQIAYHDSLTGLPNRAGFLRALGDRLHTAEREPASVLFLDLDGFKTVNDSLGHAVGDLLLVEVGARLIDAVGEHDLLARLGGDEFVVLVSSGSPAHLGRLSDRIAADLCKPFQIMGRDLVVSASIGIATAESDDDASSLFLKADLAMYRAKASGKSCSITYDARIASDARQRLDREAELRQAVADDQLVLEYQTEVDLATDRVVAAEALVRWEHPERGRVSPLDFIPLAEETGLILPIGSWVLRTACTQAAEWCRLLDDVAPMISVNVSAHQMLADGFVAEVRNVLDETGLPAPLLRLELTESVLADAGVVEPILHRLRRLGVHLAIDDLGTGYSSLGYLHRFPVDTLKIDKSFVDPIQTESDRAPVVEAVVAMGHSLDMTVVAEGIERPAQVAMLRRVGCDRVQGFLYAKPRPASVVTEALLAVHPVLAQN